MKFPEIVLTVLVVAKFVGAQSEGDLCTVLKTGQVGLCLHISKCPVVLAAAYENIFPQICRMAGTVPIVCCPRMSVLEGRYSTGILSSFINNIRCDCLLPSDVGIGRYTNYWGRPTRYYIYYSFAFKTTEHLPYLLLLETTMGSHCTLNDTMPGVCRPFADCQSAKEASCKGILPKRCDLTDNESELVCCKKADCPPLPKRLVTQLRVGSKAADYCIELAEKIHPCQQTGSGWTRGDMCPLLTPDSNIVYHNTPMTTAAEAPHFGLIGSGQRGDITWRGYSVSLVSDQWVLCSARAINNIGSSNVTWVGLGGTISPEYNPDEIYGVTTRHIHPLYDNSYYVVYNDIALLQLDRRVIFTTRILPACLHTGTPLPDSGFIQTDYNGRKTTMQRVSQEECSRTYPSHSGYHPAGIKHDLEICSRPVNTTGGCVDWSYGFPLTLHNGHRVACTHLLLGLASDYETSPCTVTNTRISSFIPWIEGIVWPEGG